MLDTLVIIELLELRRLFAADFQFGQFTLTGGPLMQPGATSNVTVIIRDPNGVGGAAVPVAFKAVPVGFSAHDEDASFSDPKAVALTAAPATAALVPQTPDGRSFTFAIPFPSDLAQGRYELVGQVGTRTRAFGAGWSLPSNGRLAVPGTNADDRMTITAGTHDGKKTYTVKVNDYAERFNASVISGFTVTGGGGNDTFIATGAIPHLNVNGGDGNDRLVGGDDGDTLAGGAGKDQLDGGLGNDRVSGNGGNDKLIGGAGADRLYGGDGNDYLDAGSSADRLDGGAGGDTMLGQSGDDTFLARDHEIDQLSGGTGTDQATADANDVLQSVERTG